MPYITKENKEDLLKTLKIRNSGELNYLLTEAIKCYLQDNGERYQTYNDILGALEGAKLELYRRKIAPYEDKKIEENGDVY